VDRTVTEPVAATPYIWIMEYWHVREPDLETGGVVALGRWRNTVLASGAYDTDNPTRDATTTESCSRSSSALSIRGRPSRASVAPSSTRSKAMPLTLAPRREQARYRVRPRDPSAVRTATACCGSPGWARVIRASNVYAPKLWHTGEAIGCLDIWKGPATCDEVREGLIVEQRIAT
jgi:hypothetical protein